jgi:hypothetical protein
VQVFNVTNPADPTLAGYYQRSGCFALGVTAWDNHALVADGPAGMQVYDFLLATDVGEMPDEEEEEILLFPNPTKDVLKIRCRIPDAGCRMIEIFTIDGRKILEKEMTEQSTIDVSKLPAGVYMIRLVSADQSITSKFIKQ